MSMQVILKSEVLNLGLPGDVVVVADGYGRNYLIPQGYAIRATPGAMKEAEALTRARLATEARTIGDAQKQAELIEARPLVIKARVDDNGHLYGSVSVGDVQTVLKERGFTLDKRRIELKSPIKQIGEYEIAVQVHPQVTATLTLEVADVDGKVGVSVGGNIEDLGEAPADVDAIEEAALAAADEIEGAEGSEESDAADAVAADEAVAEAPTDESAGESADA